MKICILSTSYPRSKDDHWVPFMHYWAKELAKTEDVTVVASGGAGAKGYEVRDNVKIYRFNYFYPKKLQRLTYRGGMRESFKKEFLAKIQVPFFMLAFMIKSFRVVGKSDVINAHWTLSGLAAIPIKVFLGKPVVLTEHGGGIRGLPKWLNRLVIRRMDAVTSAHYDMQESIKEIGISNILDIKNFLDEEKFLKNHDKKAIREELGLKEEKVVSFIGRFEEFKDPLTFVNAIGHLAKTVKNARFIIAGDGHLKEEIQERIRKLNIGKYIIMPGPSSNVDKYLAVSDAFVACSPVENCFSTTILEAMLSKVPCIITKAGATEKFFVHGRDAFLVEKKSPEILAKAIVGMLKDAKLRKKLSENGLKFLYRHGFRNKVIRKNIIGLFKRVIKDII